MINKNYNFCKVKKVSSITIFYTIILDRDECMADSPCSSNAQCNNTEGSFMCTCHEGFDGDGFNCTGRFDTIYKLVIITCVLDINECVTGSLCDNIALCENTEGSFMCVCHEGFDGDGFNCTGNENETVA